MSDDKPRVINGPVELYSVGPSLNGMGAMYVAFDESATEQHVPVTCSACAAGEHGECLDIAAEPELQTCECVEGACRGEWQDVGYTEERITVDVEEVRRTAEAIEVLATFPEEHRGTILGDALHGLSIPGGYEVPPGGLGAAHIAQKRPVFAPGPIRLPEHLGGLPEDAPEQVRYRPNRSDLRRLGRRRR